MNKSQKPDFKRAHIIVDGIVQGVFFRTTAKSEADRLGVFGWVRNKIDGSVEIMAEGNKNDLERFVQWCYHGPPGADVKNANLTWEEYQGDFKSFDIAY